jgi:hypothetical protein
MPATATARPDATSRPDRTPRCPACGGEAELRHEGVPGYVALSCERCPTYTWLPVSVEHGRPECENAETLGTSGDEPRAPCIDQPSNHPAAKADGPPVPRPLVGAEEL